MYDNARLRWVVVLTAVGSFMAALDTLVVASALSTIRHDLGASLTRPRVDGQRLQPQLRRAAGAGRGARRPARPGPDVRRRAGPLRAGLGRLRARRQRGALVAHAGRAGSRRRRGDDPGPGAAHLGVPGGAARRGARAVQRGDRNRGRERTAGRRRGRRRARLAVDLLAQRAGRPGGRAAGRCGMVPEARVPGQPARRARGGRCSAAACSASSGPWCAARPPAGRAPEVLGAARGGGRAARRLRRLGAARAAPAASAAAAAACAASPPATSPSR